MAEWLLGQLREAVGKLHRYHETNSKAVDDNGTDIEQFWSVLERCFRHDSRSFTIHNDHPSPGEPDYYAFFVDALPSHPKAVPGLDLNTTPTGKGRALIRHLLSSQQLGETVQHMCENESLLKRYYHRTALLRNTTLRSQLMDVLYDLNSIPFELANKVSLDRSWPTFSARSFNEDAISYSSHAKSSRALLSPSRSVRGVAPRLKDTTSLSLSMQGISPIGSETASISSLGAGSNLSAPHWQPEGLREEHLRLRHEHDKALKTIKELRKAQQANDAHLAKVKEKNAALKLRVHELELQGGTSLDGSTNEEGKSRRMSEQTLTGLESRESQDQLQQQALAELREHMQAEHEQQLEHQSSQISELEAERETLTTAIVQAEEMRRQAEQQLAKVQSQVEELQNEMTRLQNELASMQGKRDEHQSALDACKQHYLQQQQALQQTHQKEINDYVALLQEAERRRASAEEHHLSISERHKAEKARADEAVRQNAFLEKLSMKAADAKTRMTERCGFLMEAVERMCGTWQADKDAVTCNQCQRAFGVTLRRHHCRVCGQIFCHDCSNNFASLANSKAKTRTCGACTEVLQRLKEIQQETADVASSEDSLSRLRRGSYSGPMIKTGSLREANSPSPLKRATNGRLPSVSQPDTVATQSSSSSTPHSQLTPS